MAEWEDGQLCADDDPTVEEPPAVLPAVEDETTVEVPVRDGCRTERRGWAGAHSHGAVRPRRRAVSRGRPPGRWC